MTDPKPSGSKSSTGQRPSISNITPSKVPSKVASKVMSAVDLTATKEALLKPLNLISRQPEEEYDPHKYRKVSNPTSYSETMTHMLKACFGVGMLALPHVFARLGIIFGTLLCFFLGFFATYCIQILVIAQYIVCKRHKVAYMTYPMTMRIAMKEGPTYMRWASVPFAIAVEAFLIIWQFGVCSIFLVFVGENVKEFLDSFGVTLTLRLVICCLYPPLVIMCMTKNLKLLAPLSTFSNACAMFGVALIFYYLIHDDIVLDEEKYKLKSLMDIPIFIGTVLFALEAVGVVLALEYNMENPKEFTGWCGLFSVGMIIITSLYATLGIFGYLKYGMEAKASVTLNLPQHEKKARVAHMSFAATIFTTYPLQNCVAWQFIWNIVEPRVSDEKKYRSDMITRVACSSLPFVFAVAVPTLGPLVGLLGSLCLTTAAILLPAILDMTVFYPNNYGFCNYKLITDFLIIVFGAFCCFSGCYVSILEMIELLGEVE